METEVEDLAGVRIICQFEEDIDTVAAIIRRRTDMEVKSEKNYLTHIKQSGYRSYHMILYYIVETINGPKTTSGGSSDPYDGNEFLGYH